MFQISIGEAFRKPINYDVICDTIIMSFWNSFMNEVVDQTKADFLCLYWHQMIFEGVRSSNLIFDKNALHNRIFTVSLSATCPKNRPNAQEEIVLGTKVNFCCPAFVLVKPADENDPQANECEICRIDGNKNCDNYGNSFWFSILNIIAWRTRLFI